MARRILFVIPTLDQAGAEKQLVMLATGLDRAEFEPHVCALTRGGPREEPLRSAGIPVTVIGKRGKINPVAFWRLRSHIQELRPALVHTWLFAANSYGRAASLSAGVPHLIATERCVDLWKSWHELAIDRYLATRTEIIVANSSGVIDFYRSKGIPAALFRVIPNGVSLPGTQAFSREELFNELGLAPESRLIATIGRLWPQKGIRDVIWATDHLKVIRNDVHLLILGDGPLRSTLEKYTRQIEVDDHVHFLGHRDDVERILPHLDAVLSGSRFEGLPNSLMEAMAAGLPVIATDIPGNRDLITHESTGLLARPGSVSDLARLTDKVLNDRALAERLGSAAAAKMATEYTPAKMVERHACLYRELLANG